MITKKQSLIVFILFQVFQFSCNTIKQSSIEKEKESLYPIKINNKWGFSNQMGEVVIEYKFDSVDLFIGELAVAKNGEKFGFINKNGNWEIRPKYDQVNRFRGICTSVKKNNKWRWINRKGKRVKKCYNGISGGCIPPQKPISPKKYSIYNGEKYALIYKELRMNPVTNQLERVIDTTNFVYDSIMKYNRICLVVKKDRKLGLYNPEKYPYRNYVKGQPLQEDLYGKKNNEIEIRFPYDEIDLNYPTYNNDGEEYSIHNTKYKKDKMWGVLNSVGEEVTEAKYYDIKMGPGIMAFVEYEPSKFGYINYHWKIEFFRKEN